MVKKTKKEQIEVAEKETKEETEKETGKDKGSETFNRILYTLLFALIGWVSLWIFTFVILIQFGFLLITGQINKNLKGFGQEVGLFLYDIIKYLSFQTDTKPFPFRDWSYSEETSNLNNTELNKQGTVKVGK